MPVSTANGTPPRAGDREEEDVDEEAIDFTDIEARFKQRVAAAPDPLESVVVVDNVPVVDKSKEARLFTVFRKILAKIGQLADDENGGIVMPYDEGTGKSKGFMFITFQTPEEAEVAVREANGYRLDASHRLAVTKFRDVERIANAPEEYVEPPAKEVEDDAIKARAQAQSHLLSPHAATRDQMLLMRNEEVGVFWSGGRGEPELAYTRANWTDLPPQFSPHGTFVCTFHKQGVALWCGPKFERAARWAHPGVRLVEWSPGEGYACTWGPETARGEDGEPWNCAIWSTSPLHTGPLRTFLVEPPAAQPGPDGQPRRQLEWPVFRFSRDDAYVARAVAGDKAGIYVYELPGMGLVDRKPIRIDDVQAFSWSPADNALAYWVPEAGNNPARVTVMRFPSREPVRTANLFLVADVKLHWSPSGSHLAVQVTRFTKTKKSTFTAFEVVRLKDKDIPIDSFELKATETVAQVTWEPSDTSHRFAVLATEGLGAAMKTNVYIYEAPAPLPPGQAAPPPPPTASSAVPVGVRLARTLERKGVAGVHWSPRGRFMVLRGAGGDLEFYDADDGAALAQQEHFGLGQVEWDPSGRFVASVVTGWKSGLDTGYNLYSAMGQALFKKNLAGLRFFSWRPRPPTLLSNDQQRAVRKNLRKYTERYDKMDAEEETAAGRETKERKRKLWEEWRAYRTECEERARAEAGERERLRGWSEDERPVEGVVGEDGGEEVEEWQEEIIEETEEEVDEATMRGDQASDIDDRD